MAQLLPSNEHGFIGPKTMWGLLGVIPLLTGTIGNSPIYTLLGISTCSVKQRAG